MSLSYAEVRRIAEKLGHSNLRVKGSGTRWSCSCSCGYKSTRRQTEALAAQAAAHHLTTIATAYYNQARASGHAV